MPRVTLNNTGEFVDVNSGASLRETVQNEGWPVAFSCEEGICGTCVVKIVEGAENLSPMTDVEKTTLDTMGMNDGQTRLACQCTINGDVTLERF